MSHWVNKRKHQRIENAKIQRAKIISVIKRDGEHGPFFVWGLKLDNERELNYATSRSLHPKSNLYELLKASKAVCLDDDEVELNEAIGSVIQVELTHEEKEHDGDIYVFQNVVSVKPR